MKNHFIVSIGTSITGKYKPIVLKDRSDLELKAQKEPFEKKELPAPGWFLKGGEEEYHSRIAPVLNRSDKKGAEQQTLDDRKLKALRSSESVYHLIATDTMESLFCASFLSHEPLKDREVWVYIPPGLEYTNGDHFKNTGIPNLLTCVAGILDCLEKKAEEQAIIVPTGGFKFITPYMAIASILYKRPAYYIYEKSDYVIEFPAPPLNVDMSAYRSVLPLLENVIDDDPEKVEPYFDALPPGFQMMLHTDDSGKYAYTAFGERLKSMYLQQTGSPLTLRASGNSLIPRLGSHADLFLKMTRLGETVWLGDKAPEMADHARRHHLNLFAYAELLLLPILTDNRTFLSEVELFLLLATIYLHDCGHSLSALPVDGYDAIPLLPTEIRNYHNLLGYCRLQGDEFGRTLARQGLELPKELLESVALISLYHRKKMPLLKGKCQVSETEHVFSPLIERRISFGDEAVEGDRLVLILSLFRIIDGMDKQVERAGDAVEISMRAEAILSDLPYLLARRKRLESAIIQVGAGGKDENDPKGKKDAMVVIKEVEKILRDIVENYGCGESVGGGPGEVADALEKKACGGGAPCGFEVLSPDNASEMLRYDELEMALQSNGAERFLPLAWEYLDARSRLFFQALQPTYYHSDLLLSMPRVNHAKDEISCITISYRDNPDTGRAVEKLESVREAIFQWVEKNLDKDDPESRVILARLTDPKSVVCGIRDEYCSRKNSEVAEILRRNNMVVEYRYDNEPVSCWR